VGPDFPWQYNTETGVRETGFEFAGIILLRIVSYHDLLRTGKYISQLHKINDDLQDCRLPKNDRTPHSKTVYTTWKFPWSVSVSIYEAPDPT